jgi:hypothetical protein
MCKRCFWLCEPRSPGIVALGGRGSGIGHRQRFADIDQIVGQHAQFNPAFHSLAAAIQTAPQSLPRLATLMRPSQPVRQRCAYLNQRLFSICLRSALRVARFGTATHFTPFSCTCASLPNSVGLLALPSREAIRRFHGVRVRPEMAKPPTTASTPVESQSSASLCPSSPAQP